ncbi:hypothetical protein F4778DRAFT_235244 [Xylariomycetidae sp. FL2044]|nr:hypothetical protein F4778DRAFT_235244 [Xylariomycetidae sp. FL2044]
MAHSLLLRTMMRAHLDHNATSLTNYEVEIDKICMKLHDLPPLTETFDATRWSESRKQYESKKERDLEVERCERGFLGALKVQAYHATTAGRRSAHYRAMFNMSQKIIQPKESRKKLAIAKSGYTKWRPRSTADCLQAEDHSYAPPSEGRVVAADQGTIDPRKLRRTLTPAYVPKPRLRGERMRLQAKSAEFAAFVARQGALEPSRRRVNVPRPEDLSSDGALHPETWSQENHKHLFFFGDSDFDDDDDDNTTTTTTPGPSTTGMKRKRGGAANNNNNTAKSLRPMKKNKSNKKKKKKKTSATTSSSTTTTKPTRPFVKTYDAWVHDRKQLEAQGRNRFSLMQQRLPRIEVPTIEQRTRRPLGKTSSSSSNSTLLPVEMDVDIEAEKEEDEDEETPAQISMRLYGIVVPVLLPGSSSRIDKGSEKEEVEIEMPSLQDALGYQRWRAGEARGFFEERDRYVQARHYGERASDRELDHAIRIFLEFRNKYA